MAQVQSHLQSQNLRPSTPPRRLLNAPVLSPNRMPNPLLTQASFKAGHRNLDTFSPVDQNGSFCFDRVIKSGKVHRRIKKKGAWKPSWKPAYLVLRPNLLSIYKDEDGTVLRASIALSDITAVTAVRKLHTNHVFGVFSPSKNYHFQGLSDKDAADWIAQIRVEARTDEQDELEPPTPQFTRGQGDQEGYVSTDGSADDSPDAPGSPELPQSTARGKARTKTPTTRPRRTSNLQDYSGNEIMTTSHSDFSDFQPGSIPKSVANSLPKVGALSPIASAQQLRPTAGVRSVSQVSISHLDVMNDPERVIRQGWLQVLRTKTGVKNWKAMWCVLRPKNLCFYKDQQEYSTVKLLPMNSIINAAEIDPISRSKQFCFQIIIEEKTYRLSAPDDEELAKWLGALKSVLSKRAETIKGKGLSIVDATANMMLR